MEKLLTITIPTYNTEQYLPRCIESLIVPRYMDKLEILVVVDGSPDNSLEVAREYEAQYPQTIKVVNKLNGGHGSVINKGIELATGKYFRVLDSDDWFDTEEFDKYLEELEKWDVDFVLNPYRKFFLDGSPERIMHIEGSLQCNTLLNVEKTDFSKLIGFKFIRMAGVAYKTKILKTSNITLPERAYYVDSIYVLCHIHQINSYIVLDQNVYIYFIGREDQSMNPQNVIKNIKSILIYAKYITTYFETYKNSLTLNKLWYLKIEVVDRIKIITNLIRRTNIPKEEYTELIKYIWKESKEIWLVLCFHECKEQVKHTVRKLYYHIKK